MEKRRLKFIIPTMVIVAVTAVFMLAKYHTEVPTNHRVLIVISATLLSGVLAHGLFPHDDEEAPDPKPNMNKKNK
ncbi:hypothetical protein [Lysinibacillus endophyticus]|uniref:Uncharacterized protein n=1 Tax=Ureibacillus endophyticus TaxID=1978490 RepID=A0A494YXA2_9BACL|nr:hypothetical protein [Lysinibacillus endophyticus]MCP1146510.1 hypothetical protein [Lysinibacillus endophyticus]RKQ14852.1 hypothetical protein D8M03_12980 [Lysinibacillus endophyticus]